MQWAGRAGIRDAILTALDSWAHPPRHVVLVGVYRSNSLTTPACPEDTSWAQIPAFHIPSEDLASTWSNENNPCPWYPTTPTDDPYVFPASGSDSVPAISVGRIPLPDAASLARYVDKVVAYEGSAGAPWQRNALCVAQDRNLDGNLGVVTHVHAESLWFHCSGRLASSSRNILFGAESPAPQFGGSLSAIIDLWNDPGFGIGVALATGAERMIFAYRMVSGYECLGPAAGYPPSDSLLPSGHTPIWLTLTCSAGWVAPDPCKTLQQWLLAAEARGAVAVLAPARGIHETPSYVLSREWMRRAFDWNGDPYVEPGRVLREAKAAAMSELSSPIHRREILSVHCYGDPALQMWVPYPVIGVGEPPAAGRSPPGISIVALQAPGPRVQFLLSGPAAGPYEVSLYGVRGRRVDRRTESFEEAPAGARVAFAGERRSGVYFAVVRHGTQVAVQKFVVLTGGAR